MIDPKIIYTRRMAEYDRKLEIAKKVALVLSENRARVDDLHDIFSLAQKQLSVSILPEAELDAAAAERKKRYDTVGPVYVHLLRLKKTLENNRAHISEHELNTRLKKPYERLFREIADLERELGEQ